MVKQIQTNIHTPKYMCIYQTQCLCVDVTVTGCKITIEITSNVVLMYSAISESILIALKLQWITHEERANTDVHITALTRTVEKENKYLY